MTAKQGAGRTGIPTEYSEVGGLLSIRGIFEQVIRLLGVKSHPDSAAGFLSKSDILAEKSDHARTPTRHAPALGKPPKGWIPKAKLAKVMRQLDREKRQKHKRAAHGNL